MANFLTTMQDRFVTEGGIKERMFQARTTSSILNSQLSTFTLISPALRTKFYISYHDLYKSCFYSYKS